MQVGWSLDLGLGGSFLYGLIHMIEAVPNNPY